MSGTALAATGGTIILGKDNKAINELAVCPSGYRATGGGFKRHGCAPPTESSWTRKALRVAKAAMFSGRTPSLGIDAPLTSTGTTTIP